MMRLAVVIPYYNAPDDAEACIRSVLRSTYPVEQVYVVDNSTLETDIAARFALDGRVSVIRTAPRIGFGRANNIGVAKATEAGADIAVVMNQDATIQPDALEALVQPFAGDANIALATPLVYAYDGTMRLTETYVKMYIAPLTALLSDWSVGSVQPYYELQRSMSGACVAVRCSAAQRYGLFCPLIDMYAEDVELFEHYRRIGQKAVLVPAAKLLHRHGHAAATGSKQRWVKRQIHKHTPVSIFTNIDKSIVACLTDWLAYALRDYATAAAHGRFRLLSAFFLDDIQLFAFRMGAILKVRAEYAAQKPR